ncbi:MAG: preprotein translocase subunit SecG [Bacteroidales bacterium]|nr:preprotein translocase subunit SecG [Bacteroidales bacterium]
MYTLLSVLVIIISVLLVLIVLVQNSKGGGLASNFGQGNQIMGVKKTADFLEKATWTLAIALLVVCLVASMTISNPQGKEIQQTTTTELPASQVPVE